MGNLYGSLLSTASSLQVYERALSTVQNNVVNSGTPGYAKQLQGLRANRFEPDRNIVGGVSAGETIDYRDVFAERNVQSRSSQKSLEQQRVNSLTGIESAFPVQQGAGIPAAFNNFFNSVSQLSVNPNDAAGRQVLLDRAGDVAATFNRAARQLAEQKGGTQVSLKSGIDQINEIGTTLREINIDLRQSAAGGGEAGSEAKLYSTLEELSQLVDFSSIRSQDGSISVYIGGQTPLVIGERQYSLSTDISNQQVRVLDSEGSVITDEISGGKVAGLIDIYNRKIPGYTAELDQLAAAFADQVNQTLSQGIDQNGNAPTQDLFGYDGVLGAAFTLAVGGLTSDQLALAGANEPGGNANAIALTELAQARGVNNQTFQEFYGTAAAKVGRDLARSLGGASVQSDLLNQAKELRQMNQGVSLDEQAALLIQFQRSYEAASQLFKTLNELTAAIINVLN